MKVRRIICLIFLAGLLAIVAGAAAAQETESFSGDISGRKTWTIRYGIGSPLALAAGGLAPGQLTLDQTLAVDIEATALGILRIEGHFDDQQPASMQTVSVYLDSGNLHGIFGDFVVPEIGEFSAFSRKMKGLRLDYDLADITVTAIASQLEGVTQFKTFVGQTDQATLMFSYARPGDPEQAQAYPLNLEGLAAFELVSLYVPEFADVVFSLPPGETLNTVLARYGVGDLRLALDPYAGRVLEEEEFAVISDGTQHLLLESAPIVLVRRTVLGAIDAYNADAESGDRIDYPFARGSEIELQFLRDLLPAAWLHVGSDNYALTDALYRRFYDLGESEILEDSLVVEVDPDGAGFRSIDDPLLYDYRVTLRASEGVLEVAFPDAFFQHAEARMRVSFSYSVVGGTYMLGFSLVPDSERVTLNGQLLQRNVDYTIDYEIGMLGMLVDVGPQDVIRVEFERYSGGLGGIGDYTRYFYGVSIDLPVSDTLSLAAHLLRAADDPRSAQNPETVSTMPNQQTVAGVVASVALDTFTADFAIGYADDRFPFDDNEKTALPNRIHAIATNFEYAFVGHEAGFSALRDGIWRSYNTASGLSGRSVRAIDADDQRVAFGTSAGLTIVNLEGAAPLTYITNWSRYYEQDGLPDNSVQAVLFAGDVLWVGTDGGLAKIETAQLDEGGPWDADSRPEFDGIRALAASHGELFVGTVDGLYRFDVATGEVDAVVGTAGLTVLDLEVGSKGIYVASERGLAMLEGLSLRWLVRDLAVRAVAERAGEVFYAGAHGTVRLSDGAVSHAGWAVTALHAAEDGLWIGTEADADGRLMLWEQNGTEQAYDNQVTKIDGVNPYRYEDIPAAEHTRRGFYVRAGFAEDGDGYGLSGSFDAVDPGYRAIGVASRNEQAGWRLTGNIDLGGGASLRLDHAYEMRDMTAATAESLVDNALSFRWDFGPVLTAGFRHENENNDPLAPGPESQAIQYSIGLADTLFGDAVSFSAGWQESLTWATRVVPSISSRLSANIDWAVMPDLTTRFRWQRPLRITGDHWNGSESWAWSIQGGFGQPGYAVSAAYDIDASRTLPAGAFAWKQTAEASLDVDSWNLGAWLITPTGSLSGTLEDGSLSLSGRLNVRTLWETLSIRTTVSADVNDLGAQVERWTEKLSSTANYSGVQGLRPSLTYTLSRSLTKYEGVGTRSTLSHLLNGRLTWSDAAGNASDTLSLVVRWQPENPRRFTSTLDNTYQQDVTSWFSGWLYDREEPAEERSGYPLISLRANANADLRVDEGTLNATWTVAGTADVSLSETWNVSFGSSYRGGAKSAAAPYHGLSLELTLAITF